MNYIDTPEEAIECLSYHGRNLNQNTELAQAHKVAEAALKKQIPKKPIERPPGKSFGICPDCMHDVYNRKDINNCANCGQALNWGNDNG